MRMFYICIDFETINYFTIIECVYDRQCNDIYDQNPISIPKYLACETK